MSNARKRPSKKRRKRRNFRVSPWVLLFIVGLAAILVYAWRTNPDIVQDVTNWVRNGWGDFFDNNEPIVIPDGEAIIHFIDVGQGDAVLIQTSNGNMLIDGGDIGLGDRVLAYLRFAGVSRFDYVIATHPHADHIGGLVDVINTLPIGTLIMPPVAHTTRIFERFLDAIENNGVNLREPIAGDRYALGEGGFTIIAPNSSGYANLNDYSVSLRFDFGANSFIFTGDAERISENEMIAAGHNLRADVLHIGHHGSHTSTTRNFLNAVRPNIAVISVGESNSHGHPHDVVMNRLNNADLRIYRTDHHGNITITTNGENLWVNYE